MQAVGHLGYESGYHVCAAGLKEEFDPAWLYDLIWYEQDENEFLLNVTLAVESEWGENFKHIKYDFEKLLAAKATHHLMVFQTRNFHKEERLQYFRDAVLIYRHRQPGDRYLIALLDTVDETFHFELIILTSIDTVESITVF
jgi:hypothetical protein